MLRLDFGDIDREAGSSEPLEPTKRIRVSPRIILVDLAKEATHVEHHPEVVGESTKDKSREPSFPDRLAGNSSVSLTSLLHRQVVAGEFDCTTGELVGFEECLSSKVT
jgi:hypothetical protein